MVVSRIKQFFVGPLAGLVLASSSCSDYKIKSVSDYPSTTEASNGIEELLDFEKELYQRDIKVKREVLLKKITYSKETVGEANKYRRNEVIQAMAEFDIVALEGRPLTKKITLLNANPSTSISETELFHQSEELKANMNFHIPLDIELGDYNLEFTIKDEEFGAEASMSKKIKIEREESLNISSLELCTSATGPCEVVERLNDARRVYARLGIRSYHVNLERLVINGKHTLESSNGKVLINKPFSLKKDNPEDLEEIKHVQQISLPRKMPIGRYTFKSNLGIQGKKTVQSHVPAFLTGLRISDFKFCNSDELKENDCTRNRNSFILNMQESATINYRVKVDSLTADKSNTVSVSINTICPKSNPLNESFDNYYSSTVFAYAMNFLPHPNIRHGQLNVGMDVSPYCDVTVTAKNAERDVQKRKRFSLKKGWGEFQISRAAGTNDMYVSGILTGNGINHNFTVVWDDFSIRGDKSIILKTGKYQIRYNTIQRVGRSCPPLKCNISIIPGSNYGIDLGSYAYNCRDHRGVIYPRSAPRSCEMDI